MTQDESNDSTEPAVAPDIGAVKWQARLIHVACAAVMAGAVALRYTLLADMPDAGAVLFPVVTLIWGALGFTPPKPVLTLAIAALESKKLSAMLSLRPAVAGNALVSEPPPKAAAAATMPRIPRAAAVPHVDTLRPPPFDEDAK